MAERRRWADVEALCQAALDRRPDERRAFIATACGADEELRREVDGLLVHADTEAAFLESPLAAVAAHALGTEENALSGSRLGSLAIGPVIGRGGMGEVYLARDTRLERNVAIKVLPTVFAQDPDRLARFKREALILGQQVRRPFHPAATRLWPELQSDESIDSNVRLPPQTHVNSDGDAITNECPHTSSGRERPFA